jgi:hypothetical protein
MRLLRIVGVVQRTVRIGLACDSEANLARLNDSDLQIRDRSWYCTSGICVISLTGITDYEAGVSVGFGLQPD